MDINNASIEQLRMEIREREMAERDAEKPQMIYAPDFSQVKEYCSNYIDAVENGETEGEGSGLKQYIFEESITACYGAGVWDWINSKL